MAQHGIKVCDADQVYSGKVLSGLHCHVTVPHKGRTSARSIECDFPPIVEVLVPPCGFCKRLDNIHAH